MTTYVVNTESVIQIPLLLTSCMAYRKFQVKIMCNDCNHFEGQNFYSPQVWQC